ncbi:DUF6271 family protein [Stigmatella erecta]|uniref:Uncharacterized protein n=1 Tax=Stigmatella erecta TaxID=83460 RepID=A0A1I0IKF7_9BACT|nr:DUF6271 family protein [Stigmatella erecta]SET97478.1 hypothetical protein SAMN05443639_106119 [Stigmatella erecta]
MFAIPTNRLVSPAARSILREMHLMQEAGVDPEELVILDNSTGEIVRHNARDLALLRQETRIPIRHVTAGEQLQLIDALARVTGQERGVLRDLLYPEPNTGDYGKVFNLLYLLAAAHGRRVIHRRDSDCSTEGLEPALYPVHGELRFLGKTLAQAQAGTDTVERLPAAAMGKEIQIAGSDYIGHWNLDLMDLEAQSPQAMPALLKLLSVPPQQIPVYLHAKYRGRNEDYRPRPLLITCETGAETPEITPYYPECGNLAMKDVFRRIPNFIGARCIGFDYHTYILGTMLGVPAVYHRNKIVHAHDAVRRRQRDLKAYWTGIIKLADYNHFITAVGQSEAFARLAAMNAPDGAAIANVLSACQAERSGAERLSLIDRMAEEVLRASGVPAYEETARWLKSRGESLVEELDQDYRRSIALQREWPAYIRGADALARAEVLLRMPREPHAQRMAGAAP